jgi:hypothetical protein
VCSRYTVRCHRLLKAQVIVYYLGQLMAILAANPPVPLPTDVHICSSYHPHRRNPWTLIYPQVHPLVDINLLYSANRAPTTCTLHKYFILWILATLRERRNFTGVTHLTFRSVCSCT